MKKIGKLKLSKAQMLSPEEQKGLLGGWKPGFKHPCQLLDPGCHCSDVGDSHHKTLIYTEDVYIEKEYKYGMYDDSITIILPGHHTEIYEQESVCRKTFWSNGRKYAVHNTYAMVLRSESTVEISGCDGH